MKKEIKLLVERFTLFLLLLIICYSLLVVVWGEFLPARLQKNLSFQKFGSGHSSSRLEEANSIRNIDVLFLGSSRSYRHYDTRIFEKEGFNVFNLGTSSQTMIQTEYLVNKFYHQMNPRIVIFDLYPHMFTADGVESSLDIISNEDLTWQSLDLVFKHKNIKVLNTYIYSAYFNIFYQEEKEEWYKKSKRDTYIQGGYVEREISFSEVEESSQVEIAPLSSQVAAFNRVVEIIKNSRAELFLVQSPMHLGINYSNFQVIDSIIEINNLRLYNFQHLSALEDNFHFYDAYHLNQKGVEVYNEIFIDQLLSTESVGK